MNIRKPHRELEALTIELCHGLIDFEVVRFRLTVEGSGLRA